MVIEIPGDENDKLAVPVINTLVGHTAFLATDTQLCVLILIIIMLGSTESYPTQSLIIIMIFISFSINERFKF